MYAIYLYVDLVQFSLFSTELIFFKYQFDSIFQLHLKHEALCGLNRKLPNYGSTN